MISHAITSAERIRSEQHRLREGEPKLRAREVAARLGISEAELVAASCGDTTRRLVPDFAAILRELPALGPVMSLTRNSSAVHEKRGIFPAPSINGSVGLVHGEELDLRLFLDRWHVGFAVTEGERRSLQFFDAAGVAVLKVHHEGEPALFEALAEKLAAADQSPEQQVARIPPPVDRPDAEIDVEALRGDWNALEDTHHFHAMLRRHRVGRLQALRLIGTQLACRLPNDILLGLLEKAASREVSIMVFVGNRGCIQIHTGPVRRVVQLGPWINVLDQRFNLHLRGDEVASAWIVRKPTRDGTVSSVELFDAAGESIAMLFGERKPGQSEASDWRELLVELEERHA